MMTSSLTLTRSWSGWVLCAVVALLTVFAAVDAFARGFIHTGITTLIGGAAAAWLVALALVLPKVVASPSELVVHNMFRTVRIPWLSLQEARNSYFVELVDHDAVVTRAWSAPVQGMAQRRRALRHRAADADLLHHGVDPSELAAQAQKAGRGMDLVASIMRLRDTQLAAIEEGSLESSQASGPVTRETAPLPWVVFGILAASTLLLAFL